MSLSNEVLDALLAAGATAEMIVAAIKAENARDAEKLAARRAKDAARQRKHRGHAMSRVTRRDIRGQDVTARDPLPPVPPSPPPHHPTTPSPLPPSPGFLVDADAPPQPPPEKADGSKATRLEAWLKTQDEAQLGAAWGEWAMAEEGMEQDEINRELAKFCDFWKAKGGAAGRKADWFATWRNWCRNRDNYQRKEAKRW